uniref:Uncharacterized protein n=1 Tax=Arundo donax TaxID=35708 RepID=A0A0A9FN80_ARUDO
MDRMKSKSGTRTPTLSRPGLSDLSNILFSPRFRTIVTGPGSRLSSKPCGK